MLVLVWLDYHYLVYWHLFPLGILCGLFFGKQIGVLLFSYVSIKLKFAEAPNNSNWMSLYGVSILTGIGFTMSLFVGNLAFVDNTQYIDGVKNWCINWIIIIHCLWVSNLVNVLKKINV